MSGWDSAWIFVTAVLWVAPWHVPILSPWKLQWNDVSGRRVSFSMLAFEVAALVWRLFHHEYGIAIEDAVEASMIAYALWRAWREHKPPRRRLRDRVSELGKKLSERITLTPVRVPLPIGA